ncbi:MAG: lasso peptide biosynthesis B2 protein [Dehalococcoidia bacterium]
MISAKLSRGRDTALAVVYLLKIHREYRRGNSAVARRTSRAMARVPASHPQLVSSGIETWHVARAVWRAKKWLPVHSTCLQTALATQMLFDHKGIDSVVRIGVASIDADAHAWVEVGNFVLDDQRIASRFNAFELPAAAQSAVDA